MIAIIDYDAGNIGSLINMIKRLGHDSYLTSDPSTINEASKLILPGVGAFDYGMGKLQELGLLDVLNKKQKDRTPILGICLGAQLMCQSSEEGKMNGLSWIEAKVVKFPSQTADRKLPVPHIGWDRVNAYKQSPLFSELPSDARFYFVHSFHINCLHENEILAQNFYGVPYESAFEKDNIIGVQFHPEKSHKFGKQLLKNFIEKY